MFCEGQELLAYLLPFPTQKKIIHGYLCLENVPILLHFSPLNKFGIFIAVKCCFSLQLSCDKAFWLLSQRYTNLAFPALWHWAKNLLGC